MAKFEFEVGQEQRGKRLDRSVAAVANIRGFELSNSRAKKLVDEGGVTLDGKPAWKASRKLAAGQRVEVDLPDEWLNDGRERVTVGDRVLYQDQFIIAIDKPSGVPTHATHDPDREHVQLAVERLLKGQGTPSPYVAVHHRLDVDTSGVLVFATSREANKGLADAFSERTARKVYLALVESRQLDSLAEQFVIDNHLGRDRHTSRTRMRAVVSGGDRAITEFRVLQSHGSVTMVGARPKTGRTQQIRVHLSEHGAPILADEDYGGPSTVGGMKVDRLMLHASSLELPHPVSGELLSICAPLPLDFQSTAQRLGF